MKKLLFLLVVFLVGCSPVQAKEKKISPLSLDWEKNHRLIEPPQGFRYYMGTIEYGMVVHMGTEDLLGAETELQLSYTRTGRISKAVLILGPLGIDEQNCIKKYKKAVKWLNKKYGHFKYKKIEKDPVMDELLYVADCYPVSIGLYKVDSVWFFQGFTITASLLGEDAEFFVEIEYIRQVSDQVRKRTKAQEVMKRL